MTAVALMVAALALQATSLLLLRQQLFGTWLQRPFPVMVIVAVFYHGAAELISLLPDAAVANMYRGSVSAEEIQLGAFVVSLGIFVSTICYLVGLGHGGRHLQPDTGNILEAMRVLDWRILVAVLIPLAVTTYSGQGYSSGIPMNSLDQPLIQLVAQGLFVVFVVLATFSIIVRHGRKAFIPAIAGQALIMAACGQRMEILLSAIIVLMLLSMAGMSPPKKQVATVAVIGVFLVMSITSVRVGGRDIFYSNSSLEERVTAITTAMFNPPAKTGGRPLLSQLTERLDGNEFPAVVLAGLKTRPPMGGIGEVWNSMSIAVPSLLNPDKINGDLGSRSSKNAQVEYFNLLRLDHLTGHFALWLGLVGPWLHVPLMGIFGMVFARFEKWTMTRVTAARIVLFVLLAIGALFYERGIPSILTFLRYGLVLGPALFVMQKALPKKAGVEASPTSRLRPSRVRPSSGKTYR